MTLHFDKPLMSSRHTIAGIVSLYAFFAALWIVASSFLLTFAIENPVLRSRLGLTNGLVFVAVTSALLYLLLKRDDSLPAAGSAQTSDIAPPNTTRLTLLFIALALVVPLIGLAIVKLRLPQVEQEAYANLEVIAKLKAAQIEYWLTERQADSEVLAGDDAFIARVSQFMQQEHDAELSKAIQNRLDKLRSNYRYTKILLLAPDGRLLLSSGEEARTAPVPPELLSQARDSKQVQRRDIYRDAQGHIHLEWAVPLVVSNAQGKHAVAVVVLRVAAQRFIFPLIQRWPTASASGETMLVRREGESIVFLNDLRHRQDTALRLMLPLSDTERTAAAAISDTKPGTVQGKDYRDITVLAAYRPVEGTNWHIVAKVDRSEVLMPMWNMVYWIGSVAFVALSLVMGALLLLWRQQQRIYQLQMQAHSMKVVEESERRFRAVAQTANDAIITTDSHGNIVSWNPSAEQMFGYSEAEIAGQPLTRLMPERFHERHLDGLTGATEEAPHELGKLIELAGLRKDGAEFPLELSLAQWQTAAGRFISATMRDITERKMAEKKIRKLNVELESRIQERTQQLLETQEELVRKEKLAVLGQVAGSVGHELRNPLGVMSNAVYFLQTVLAGADDNVKEYLEIIKAEIAGSERIVSDLLDAVRTKPPHQELVSIPELIGQTLCKCTLPTSVTVKLDIPGTLPQLRVDAMQIQQVFRNLISNGVEAMPEGGTLEISAIKNGQGHNISICVRDSGVGIAPEVMPKLFQPLFTTKARGIGLGLVVVKNLTEANGGKVRVESEPGKGAAFTVVLPITSQ